MGVLLAYMFFGRGSAKQLRAVRQSSTSWVVSTKSTSRCADESASDPGRYPRRYDWRVTLTILGGGLVSPASPGSILRYWRWRQKVLTSLTSRVCVRDGCLLRCLCYFAENQQSERKDDIEAATRRMQDMKAESKGHLRCLLAMWLTTWATYVKSSCLWRRYGFQCDGRRRSA